MSMFDILPKAEPDPFFVLNDLYAKDTNASKVNLGIGIYHDDTGKKPYLPSVTTELHEFFTSAQSKALQAEYLPINGHKEFNALTKSLVFGEEIATKCGERIGQIQSPGGTAALFLAAELLIKELKLKTIHMSEQTWANHKNIFGRAGAHISFYPYQNKISNTLDFDAMCSYFLSLTEKSVILLHASCHNPTGIDPSHDQWKTILDIAQSKNFILLFDNAYQGLGDGVDEDAYPMREAARRNLEFLVATSFSKSMSLYHHRTGVLSIVSQDRSLTENTVELIKAQVIRASYSNPPILGAYIAANILSDDSKKSAWLNELSSMRIRVSRMRQELVQGLTSKGFDASSLGFQKGMFSFTGLTKEEVLSARNDSGIYMTLDGRANIAGLNPKNIGYVIDTLAKIFLTRNKIAA